MNRLVPLAALTAAALALAGARESAALAPPARAESDLQKVVYLGDRGPVLIGLNVSIDGRSFRASHRELMNKLFDYLDRDRDGTLSKTEAADAPPASALATAFALFGGGGQAPARMDANGDGQVTREELAAHYRQTGLAPFQITSTPRQTGVIRLGAGGDEASAEQLTSRLFLLLDTDKDGKLSRKELQAAPALLNQLDADEDEMLTPRELQGVVGPAGDGPLSLAIASNGSEIAASSGNVLLVVGDGQADKALAKALIAKYGKAGDKALPAAKLGLSKEALARLDADGDGHLTLAELAKFGQQEPAVTLTVRLGQRGDKEALVETSGASKLPPDVKIEKSREGVTLALGTSRLELGGPPSGGNFAFANIDINGQYKTQFQMADTDNNGYLDKQEAQKSGFFRDTFAAMDRDGDGMLYEKEMLAYVKQMESLRNLASKSCLSVVVTNKGKGLMELLDADGDGRLSVRELRNAHKVIDRLDADKDGHLAKGEVPAHHRGSFELGPPGGRSNFARVVVFAGGMGPQVALPTRTKGPVWFRKMDRNRDGDVSRAEFLGTDRQFKAIDADGDGLISVEEAERFDRRAKPSKD